MPPNTRALLLAVILFACGTGTDAVSTSRSDDIVSANGESLNGESLNGESLNGTALGSSLVGVSFAGIRLKRAGAGSFAAGFQDCCNDQVDESDDGDSVQGASTLDSAWLSGTVFYGTRWGTVYSGKDFKGAVFTGTTDSGASVPLRVDRIKNESWPDNDVWGYSVSYFDGGAGAWRPLCVDGNGATVPAIPVNGRWSHARGVAGGGAKIADPSSFTFACKGLGAIAKCVFPLRYKPWKTVNGVSLDRWHQTCVRLLRADFCGDGTPYTVNGQRVNLYDGIGVQQDTENWLIEAEWDENGARCFNPLNRSHALVPCFNDRALAACGVTLDFQLGALLMDETPLPVLQ